MRGAFALLLASSAFGAQAQRLPGALHAAPTAIAPAALGLAADPAGLSAPSNDLAPARSLLEQTAGLAPQEARLEAALGAAMPAEVSRMSPDAVVDGAQAVRLANSGQENRGIFALERDGTRRILKVLPFTESGGAFEGGPPAALRHLRGALIGEVFDGPRVLRAGLLERGGEDRSYFIESEELFPGGEGRSLKDLSSDAARGKGEAILRISPATGVEMGRSLARVLAAGVVPKDADFFVARDGRVAWLDSNLWTPSSELENGFPEAAGLELATLLRRASRAGEGGRAFLLEFLGAWRRAPLAEDFKLSVLREAFAGDPVRHPGLAARAEREAREALARSGLTPTGTPYELVLELYRR
ncbi:MAG TPA: hypothetical protein VNI01_02460 [Elusimicrobiota bacterium]|nr:hypothetical protein [Elusimicrobiota bacterium]